MALGLIRRLLPQGIDFTPLFCEQARLIGSAAAELSGVVNGKGVSADGLRRISAIELEADRVAGKIFVAANRTFNAPLDREDILLLAHELDDVVDLIEDAAKAIDRAGLKTFPEGVKAIAAAIVECADVLRETLPLLDDLASRYAAVFDHCEQIGRIEGRADEAFDAGIVELRRSVGDQRIGILAYLDLKEVFELVEEAADRCDDVANAIRTITSKHA